MKYFGGLFRKKKQKKNKQKIIKTEWKKESKNIAIINSYGIFKRAKSSSHLVNYSILTSQIFH